MFGQFNYGKGIGSYLNDLSNLNVDIVPDPDNEGKMQVLPMLGWYAGCNIIFARISLYPVHTAYPDFTLKTTIRVIIRKHTEKDSIS